eukprot:522771_1
MITIPSEILSKHIPSINKHNGHNNNNNDNNNNNNNNNNNGPPHKKRKLSNGHTECNGHNGHNNSNDIKENECINNLLEPLIIKIAFTAKEPIDGIHFIVPRDSNGTPSPNISLSSTSTNSNTNSRSSSVPLNNNKCIKKRIKKFGEMMDYNEICDEQKKNEIMYADRQCHMYSHNCNWLP